VARGGSAIDRSIDALYDAAPAGFTKERDALAKRLKADGDAAASARVKALRKPTAIAYVLNQLSRRHPEELAELVDVGRALARAQRKALRGEPGHDLRDAIGKQRAVVAALTTQTASVMKELGLAADAHLDAIARALQAALVDPAVGEQLEEGRLEKVPEAAAGFAGVEAAEGEPEEIAEPPARTHAGATAKAKTKADAKAKADAEAREARARAKADADAREARAVALEAEARRAKEAADEAQRRANAAAAVARTALGAARRARQEARRPRRR
jgi:hypothetical protein